MKALKATVLAIVAASAFAVAAEARVVGTGQSGFSAAYEADVAVSPEAAFDAFVAISKWWSKSHTWSGDANNLTLDLKSGCWCETLPNGGFARHMTLVRLDPGKSLVLQGGLGPMISMGVAGAMTVNFDEYKGGTRVTLTYNVGGYDPGNFSGLAKGVDGVLDEQFKSYVASLKR